MRVLTLAVTPAISTTFWNTIYFYTASATAGNLSYDCARGRHRTVSAAASRRHVDAFLDLFTSVAPSDASDTVLAVCLRVRQSGALRVLVALVRIILDLSAICGPRLLNVATGGVWDSFVLLPRILGCWGFFARAFLLGRLVTF